MQTLLRLHSISSGFQVRTGDSPPWADIKRSILRTRPPCANKLDAMISFVVSRSGGAKGEFLQQLAVFHRNFVEDSIRGGVPEKLYFALADFRHHYLALALMKTAWTCPPQAIVSLQSEWVNAGEILALGSTKNTDVAERVRLADKMLSQSRALTDLLVYEKSYSVRTNV